MASATAGEFAASDGWLPGSALVAGCARPLVPQAALPLQRPGSPRWRSAPIGMSSNTGWRSASATKSATGESLAA
jgi:hypothetical protein